LRCGGLRAGQGAGQEETPYTYLGWAESIRCAAAVSDKRGIPILLFRAGRSKLSAHRSLAGLSSVKKKVIAI